MSSTGDNDGVPGGGPDPREAGPAASGRAWRDAVAILGRRSIARRRLADRLAAAGHDAELVDRVLAGLDRRGWLDDEAHARAVAARILRRGPAARGLLVARLEADGIEPDLAQHVADALQEDADPARDALALAERRLAGLRGRSPASAARTIAGLLARRGFDDDTIAFVLDELRLVDAPAC